MRRGARGGGGRLLWQQDLRYRALVQYGKEKGVILNGPYTNDGNLSLVNSKHLQGTKKLTTINPEAWSGLKTKKAWQRAENNPEILNVKN